MAPRRSPINPLGVSRTFNMAALETGAALIQNLAPTRQFDIYVVGFHCAREDPTMQMEAHHYCNLVNQDFLQCIIFDGNTAEANLIGIEYIISEGLYENLPTEEWKLWHPHNYEVLSGTLAAPGLPEAIEKMVMRLLMNSYGKTWHTWHTGRHDLQGQRGDPLPFGEPKLMWSFNRDGETDPALLKDRDDAMNLDTVQKRKERQDLLGLAHPQFGVDTLKGALPDAEENPPQGVQEAGEKPT